MKKRTRSRSKSSRDELCRYCIEILDWELPYFFAANFNKHLIEGPLWEHMELKIDGKLIHPEKLADKNIEVTIIGDRKLVPVVEKPEDYRRFEPSSVGTLTVRGKQRELFGSIPFDVLGSIGSLLQSGKIKFLILLGHALYRGKADIRSIRFQKDFGPEDLMQINQQKVRIRDGATRPFLKKGKTQEDRNRGQATIA